MNQMHEALKKAGIVNDKAKLIKGYEKKPMTLADKVLIRRLLKATK